MLGDVGSIHVLTISFLVLSLAGFFWGSPTHQSTHTCRLLNSKIKEQKHLKKHMEWPQAFYNGHIPTQGSLRTKHLILGKTTKKTLVLSIDTGCLMPGSLYLMVCEIIPTSMGTVVFHPQRSPNKQPFRGPFFIAHLGWAKMLEAFEPRNRLRQLGNPWLKVWDRWSLQVEGTQNQFVGGGWTNPIQNWQSKWESSPNRGWT